MDEGHNLVRAQTQFGPQLDHLRQNTAILL